MKKHQSSLIGLFILAIILVALVALWSKESNLTFQIVFSISTALITTIVLYFYDLIRNYTNLKRYIGHWVVLKFENDYYTPLNAFVEINRDSEETLIYSYTDLGNLSNITGTIFINKNNRKTGKLIFGFKYLNQVETIYPISESSVYFDENIYKPEIPATVIRIMDLNGTEKFILEKPTDQKEFRIKVMELHNETMSKMAAPLSDEFAKKWAKLSARTLRVL